MAYQFIVEDGSGVPGANSYVTVEEADDYLVQNIHVSEKWAALDTNTKQYLLSWASRYLDQHARWNGYPTYPSARLKWPRSYVRVDGQLIDPHTIPQPIKDATCELARYLLENDLGDVREQDGLEKIKVDVIEIVFRSGYKLPKMPPELQWMLAGYGYLTGSGSTFAPIRRA